MKHHTLVLTIIIFTVTVLDKVCACRGFSFRLGRISRYGVSLGGHYADNYRMRIMFTSVVRHDMSRFRVIDLDKIKASKEVKEYNKNGELVSLSSRGYTRVRTSYYTNYGTSSSDYYDDDQDIYFDVYDVDTIHYYDADQDIYSGVYDVDTIHNYDDDQDIYFDVYDVDTIHNRTTYKNATLQHIQVRQCLHSLRVSEANAQSMLYACFKWHQSPLVIFWIPCVLLFLMWLVVPVLLSILYVQNMRGQIKSCFLYADSGQIHQYGKIEDETIENNERNRKLRLTSVIGFLAALLLSAMIASFVLTENDLFEEDSENAILKMQLLRAGITFLCLILFALLSLVNASLKVKLYKFPLCVKLSKTWACNSCNRDDEDDIDFSKRGCGIIIIALLTLVLTVVCLALDLCLLIVFIPLKIVHFLFFTPCGFLTRSLQLIMAKMYLKEINLKDFLYYAYLK